MKLIIFIFLLIVVILTMSKCGQNACESIKVGEIRLDQSQHSFSTVSHYQAIAVSPETNRVQFNCFYKDGKQSTISDCDCTTWINMNISR